MRKIFICIYFFFHLSVLFSGKTWAELNEDQCKQLIHLIKNFNHYADIQTKVIKFAKANSINTYKKICSHHALLSKKNFIYTLQKLCKKNKTFVNTLESLVEKSDTNVKKINTPDPVPAHDTQHNKHFFDPVYLNNLINNIYAQITYYKKKEFEIQFSQQEIDHIVETAKNIILAYSKH